MNTFPARPSARRPLLIVLALLALTLAWSAVATAWFFGGSLDPRFAPLQGLSAPARSLRALPGGAVLVAGEFTSVDGMPRGRIARLSSDGTLDPTYAAGLGANNTIFATDRLPDGRVLIGGDFTAFDGVARVRVARLLADGSLDAQFAPAGGPSSDVQAIVALPDGGALVAGFFTSVGGTPRGRIARLGPDGTLDPSYAAGLGANGPIYAIALQPDGSALIGGGFTSVDGVARPYLARLDPTGALDPGFAPQVDSQVRAILALPDGGAYIGGLFRSVGGTPRNRLARIAADGTLVASFDPGDHLSAGVYALVQQPDGAVVAGGNFFLDGSTTWSSVARFAPDGSYDTRLRTSLDPSRAVYSLAVQDDGNILVGGEFMQAEGQIRNRIARLYGVRERGAVSFAEPALTVDEAAGAVTLTLRRTDGSDGPVGVTLDVAGGTASASDYRGPVGPSAASNSTLKVSQVLPLPDGKALIGGAFTTVDGVPRNRVARLNADGSLDATFDPGAGANGVIETLAAQPDGRVIIAGEFQSVRGLPRSRVARLNADGSLDRTFVPPTINRFIWEVAPQADGKLLIAGDFTQVGGEARPYIARLEADGSLDRGFPVLFPVGAGFVAALQLQPDGKILIGGRFDQIGGQSRVNVARLNPDGSLDTTFVPPDFNERVREISIQPDGRVLVSGGFTGVGGQLRPYVARLNADGSLDSGFAPLPGPDGWVLDIAPGPEGTVLIGGEFTHVDGHPQAGVARLMANGSRDPRFDPAGGTDLPGIDLAPLDDGSVLLAGSFTYVGAHRSVGFARLGANGAPDPAVRAQVTDYGLLAWGDGADGERTLTLQIVNDGLEEGDETLALVLRPLRGTTGGAVQTMVLTIRDSRPPTTTPTGSPSPTMTAEAPPGGWSTLTPAARLTATATRTPVTATSTPTATAHPTAKPAQDFLRHWLPQIRR